MKRNFLPILLATTIFASGALISVDAQALLPKQTEKTEQFDKAKMHQKMAEKMTKDLGLTEEQQAKAKEIREQGRKEIEPLMDQMHKLREEMDAKRRVNMEEFEKILTPEQKAKFEELKKQAPQHDPSAFEGKEHGPRFGHHKPHHDFRGKGKLKVKSDAEK